MFVSDKTNKEMKLTEKQEYLMRDINFQLKNSDSAYIETGRYKSNSVLTVKSMMKKGLIQISYGEGYPFHSQYWVHLAEGVIFVKLTEAKES